MSSLIFWRMTANLPPSLPVPWELRSNPSHSLLTWKPASEGLWCLYWQVSLNKAMWAASSSETAQHATGVSACVLNIKNGFPFIPIWNFCETLLFLTNKTVHMSCHTGLYKIAHSVSWEGLSGSVPCMRYAIKRLCLDMSLAYFKICLFWVIIYSI